MSVPRKTASISSISRQSRQQQGPTQQQTSGAATPNTLRQQTEPTRDQDYQQQQQEEDERYDDAVSTQDEEHDERHPSNPFRPFFTLIEDANTSEYHHPTVHYIFEDDDTDLITCGALRSLEATHGPLPRSPTEGAKSTISVSQHEQHHFEKSSPLPPPQPGIQEHYIIVDFKEPGKTEAPDASKAGDAGSTTAAGPSGEQQQQPQQPPYVLSSARSLSSSWQVLNTTLSPAPTFDTSGSRPTTPDDASPVGGLMLKIEGTSGFSGAGTSDTKQGGGRQQQQQTQSLEDMLEQFEKRMGELRRVVEAGEADDEQHRYGDGEEELEDTDARETTAQE